MDDKKPDLSLTPEEVLALNESFRILMGAIMRSNQFLLTLNLTDPKQNEDIAVLLDIYSSLYTEYLDGEAKDQVIAALSKGFTSN